MLFLFRLGYLLSILNCGGGSLCRGVGARILGLWAVLGKAGWYGLPEIPLYFLVTSSTCNFGNPKVAKTVLGLNIVTIIFSSSFRPLINVEILNSSISPLILLDKTSNYVWYFSSMVICLNLGKALMGSS